MHRRTSAVRWLPLLVVALLALTASSASTHPPKSVACVETTNPAGKNVPPAGSTTLPGRRGGQNEDGFYLLTATTFDNVSGPLQIFVVDTGSGATFGPFASGTRIKYTQAPGAKPGIKLIGGPNSAVQWHITGKGDAGVYATTSFGRFPATGLVMCRVPPPPK